MATIMLTRAEKGAKIAAQDVEQINASTFFVKSQSGKAGYSVTNFRGKWTCDCPDHKFRQIECKHIIAVKGKLSATKSCIPESRFKLNLFEAPL